MNKSSRLKLNSSDSDVEIVEAVRPKPRRVTQPVASAVGNVPAHNPVIYSTSGKRDEASAKAKGKGKETQKTKAVTADQVSNCSDQKHLKQVLQPAAARYALFFPPAIMLPLDQTTLFYWSLSDTVDTKDSKKRKQDALLNNWFLELPKRLKPSSRLVCQEPQSFCHPFSHHWLYCAIGSQ